MESCNFGSWKILYLGEERAGHVIQPQQFYLYLLLAEITQEPDFRHCSY
jgi:hypothetical protein